MQTPSFHFNLLEQEFLHFRIGGVRLAMSSRHVLATRKGVLFPKAGFLPRCCYFHGRQVPLVGADAVYHVGAQLQSPRDIILLERGDRGIGLAVDEVEEHLSMLGLSDITLPGWDRSCARGTPRGTIRRYKKDILFVDAYDVVIH